MFTLNLIVSKRKKKNHLQQQSKKEHLLTKNNKIMKKLYITLSIMLITLFAQIAKAQVSTDSGTSEFLKVESVSESTDGTYNFKSFEVESPQATAYFMEMWLLPSRMSDGTYSPLYVYANDVYIGTINPTVANWQSARLEPETLNLAEGKNVITVATAAPETPGVETIKLAQNSLDASFSSDAYTQYLENAIEGKEFAIETENEEIMTLSASSDAASPVYYANVDLKYSFWKTFSFTKDQEIFFTSSSDIEHTIDVQFYGTRNVPILPPKSPGILDSLGVIKYKTTLTFRPIYLYTPATSAEMQGLSWSGLSEKALNSTKQVGTVKITIPQTGLYLVRMHSKEIGELSVADLNVNGEYYYEDAPIYFSYVPCRIPADGIEYASMTNCYSSSDNPMIFIHGGGSDKLVGYNNNGESSKLTEYGLSSLDAYISQVYYMPTTGISVSNYSSSNPDSKCSIYARVANGNHANAAKAMRNELSSTTSIGDVNDNNANSLSISIQGNLLNICSDIGIKSVKVYALSGSTLAHFTCNGTETHVSMPSTMGKGIYVVSVETKQGISSRKLVVR